jgi:hypothetical protein
MRRGIPVGLWDDWGALPQFREGSDKNMVRTEEAVAGFDADLHTLFRQGGESSPRTFP